MEFSSLIFLCIFLPAVFLLYTVIPNLRARNILLIAASLVFYAYGEIVYVLLMLFSTVLNYFCARWAARDPGHKSRAALIVAVAVNLGILGVFKYAGMLVSTFNGVTGLSVPVPQIALPIGISFFTFQALSYVIDVYRGTVEVQKNYLNILLYISFFPQLIAGPIVKYRDISAQIADRRQDIDKIARGLRRFVGGLMKKVLIANTLGATADLIFRQELGDIAVPAAWLGAVAYLFQIYYDFSGYSDMAIGLAQMFGFTIKENFNYPYGAVSVKDFWRRWHISLSTWFKEYLYIPLGGNRKGRGRAVLNRLIVFFLTGLWHGASWTFVVWGLWHGLFLLLEEYVPAMRRLPRVIGHIYTLLTVTLGFVIFNAPTIGYGFGYIGRMFAGGFDAASNSMALSQLTPWFLVIAVAAVIGCAPIRPLADRIRLRLCGSGALTAGWQAAQVCLYALAFAGLFFCILQLSPGGYNPFIYFRF